MNLEEYNKERADDRYFRSLEVYNDFKAGINIRALASIYNVSTKTIENDICFQKEAQFENIVAKEKNFNSNMNYWESKKIKKSVRELSKDFEVSVNTIQKWRKRRMVKLST